MALCRAVWMIHARGNSGTPDSGHWSTAAAKASCDASSAASKSPNSRISAATIRPQSDRYTASKAEVTSGGMPHDNFFCVGLSIWANPVRFTYGGPHMKYMLLIYKEEKAWAGFTEAQRQGFMGEFMKFTQQIQSAGQWVSSSQLQPTAAATSVR